MKKILISILLLFIFFQGSSQTVIYYCQKTNIYGFYMGGNNPKEYAKLDAIKNGAKHPKLIYYSEVIGYGALIIGYKKSGRIIRVISSGFSNKDDTILDTLKKISKNKVYDITIIKIWNFKHFHSSDYVFDYCFLK